MSAGPISESPAVEAAGSATVGLGYSVFKLVFDSLLSGLLLTCLVPILVLIAVLIRLSSHGPALFRQVRVGKDGTSFTMLKFRTMRVDADDSVHRDYVRRLLTDDAPSNGGESGVYKLSNDPRITGVGRFLRRTSLDEMPQLVNVLRGEMSLVGPRPALAWEVELYQPGHRRRLLARPGITGLWQVSGRSKLTMLQALDLDCEYIERRSLLLDLWILVRTPLSLMKGASAR